MHEIDFFCCPYHWDLIAVVELQVGQVAQLLGTLARGIGLVGGFGRVHVVTMKGGRIRAGSRDDAKNSRGFVKFPIGGPQS